MTHLCCLTFLRTCLYNHPVQRCCRIILMVVIVVMLLVAIYPTGRFQRTSSSAGTPALYYYRKEFESDGLPYYSIVCSIIIIYLSFTSRVCRLHKISSVDWMGKVRESVSKCAKYYLRRIYTWKISRHPKSLGRTLLYHPCLAAFLTLRATVDVYSSMLIEVCDLFILKINY